MKRFCFNKKINYTEKKYNKLAITILSIFTIVIFINPYAVIFAKTKIESNGLKCILIDAGHGGIDGGASGKSSGVLEKDINLSISKKVKERLEKEGYKVLMVREGDIGLYTDDGRIRKKKLEDLANRCKLIKDPESDLFISIHLNAFPQTQYYGAQVWYAGNRESKKFAELLQSNFREDLDKSNDRKIKPGGTVYRILKDVGEKPAVIAECGFLSNAAEERKLVDPSYQQKIADSVAKSINTYFKNKTVY